MANRKISAAILFSLIISASILTACESQENSTGSGKNAQETIQNKETGDKGMETQAKEEIQEQTKYPSVTSDEKVKDYQSIVTVGDTAYELYTYLDDVAGNYAKTVNKVAAELDQKADVYDMVIPLSSGITFPDNLKDQISSTDQHEAMQKIQSKMNDKVKSVDIFDTLMKHRDEELYYRTDHHWTTLGAYYAYEDFCRAKGITPEKLDSYRKIEFDGFIGSFYNDTKDAKLKANPDTVTAYEPKSDCIMHVTASDGMKYDWPVIYDVSNYGASLKYSTFIASDNPFTVIKNKDLKDGSSCIVVKESFGNAFVPFLVDHYQTIYVVDYRYWTGSVSELAKKKKVKDVLFLNNLSMIRNKSLVGKLHRII